MARPLDSPQAVWQQEFQKYNPRTEPSWWWYNPTNYASLRLTQTAYFAVRSHVKFYRFVLPKELKPRTFVQLERCFKEPYFVQNRKTIHLHSDRDAMMLTLHANDLQQYLDNQSDQ